MGEFTRRAQLDLRDAQHIPGPLQRKFTPQRWATAFQGCGQTDADDQRIYDAALAIHDKLSTIRAQLKVSSSDQLTPTTKLRCFVAAANHNAIVATRKTEEALAEAAKERAKQPLRGFTLEQFTNVKLKLHGGVEATPDAIFESLVDGAQMPIAFVLSGKPDLKGNPNLKDVEWRDIALELNLGIFYRYAEDVWDDCLWNGYAIEVRGQARLFAPTQPEFQTAYFTGLARRGSLHMAFSIVAEQFYRELALGGATLGGLREVRAIKKDGKRQVLKVSKAGEVTDAQQQLASLRAFACVPYYDELLNEKAVGLHGLTLNHVLTAWTVVSRASQLLMDGLEVAPAYSDEDAPPHAWLPKYAPVLQVDSLVAALGAAAGYGPQDAKRLIEFLTYRGEREQELWSQPLVPVGPSTVAPVFPAVVNPNLRRLVDVWMRQAGVDLAKRGEAFEMHIRSVVRAAIAESNVLAGHATSIAEDYSFTPPQQAGVQFDLLFFIGATVFVAEVKCVLEPTEAKGIAMHRKTIMDAAAQALVRVEVLETNRRRFAADIQQRFGIQLPENFKTVPLVVLSTTTHVGTPAKGVSVIDEYILERFLSGELEDMAVQGEGHKEVDRVKTIFYSDVAEAEARASDYFAHPPQMDRFLKGVGTELTPFPRVSDGDWEGAVVTLFCRPEGPPPAFAAAQAAGARDAVADGSN